MIVWLASYPRSGNTLLRQVLNASLGLGSYSDEPGDADPGKQPVDVLREVGVLKVDEDWQAFYERATHSKEVFLVKTHRPPRDDQPAIYVVRDGRKALLSYERFHRRYTPEPRPDLLGLVLGTDFYGSWTDHFHAWVTARTTTFVVSFEDLVKPSWSLLTALADVTQSVQGPRDWQNPFERLHARNPDFFREGQIDWHGDPEWTPWIDSHFMYLHGDLMVQRGYVLESEVVRARTALGPEQPALLAIVRGLLAERAQLQRVCDERMTVIEGLESACNERLGLVEALSRRLAEWVR